MPAFAVTAAIWLYSSAAFFTWSRVGYRLCLPLTNGPIGQKLWPEGPIGLRCNRSENRVYRALLGRHMPRWRLQDAQRKALAKKARPLGKLLAQVITIV